MENPSYIRLNSYWRELFVLGVLPIAMLIFMNLKIHQKIRASSRHPPFQTVYFPLHTGSILFITCDP
jgi:cytochrome c oxidase assembly factor CtaG